LAHLNLINAGPANAGNAMTGVTINGTAVANADVDDWRDAVASAGVANQYNSSEAGIVCAKLSSQGFHYTLMQVANNTLQIDQHNRADNVATALTGTRAIFALNNYTLFRTAFRTALNAIPAANKINSTATDKEIDD